VPETYDLFRYISYTRYRWKFAAVTCALAGALTLADNLAMTKQYTATSRIVIEPPAGTDLRSAMAVSPIYLESLKTYEEFARGDSLFRGALDRYHLRALLGAGPIESLKKRVLKVTLVRNTRILEIAATLPDARRAQELAQFVAESAVNLNQGILADSDRELLGGISADEQQARERLNAAEADWAREMASEPTQDLQAGIENGAELRARVQQDVINAEVDLADAVQREKQVKDTHSADAPGETADARARLDEMRRQLAAIDAQMAQREKLLAERLGHRDRIDAERKAAQAGLAAVETRLREARADAGYRGERLRIVDPGIVPERPSSPNIPLDVAAGLLLGALLPLLYLAIEMNYREHWALERGAVVRSMVKAGRE